MLVAISLALANLGGFLNVYANTVLMRDILVSGRLSVLQVDS